MFDNKSGSFRLFTAFGITVDLHWSWFVVALFFAMNSDLFRSTFWFVAAYVTLFAIVTLHEFGHALACRSVGGEAKRIILWPLGGIAFVKPPPRPGALLWSIIAGPLVNAVLVPVTFVIALLLVPSWDIAALPDWQRFVVIITLMNLGLLLFNMLPVYPLDGGQTLQALLWFFVGRVKSLQIAAKIGLGVAVVGVVLSLLTREWFILLMAVFVGFQAWNGLRVARYLAANGGYAPGELRPYRGG